MHASSYKHLGQELFNIRFIIGITREFIDRI